MRISRLDKSQVDGATAGIYEHYLKERGNVPNMFRTLARRPEIMMTAEAHMNAVLNTGTVDKALKEMVVVRTSANNRCAY